MPSSWFSINEAYKNKESSLTAVILSAPAFLCLYFLAFRNVQCLPFEIFRLARHSHFELAYRVRIYFVTERKGTALGLLTQPRGPHWQPIAYLSRELDVISCGGHTVKE